MHHTYTDVTHRTDLPTPYPEVVAAFEAVAWRRLGRYALELSQEASERLMRDYAEPARSEFAAHLPDVATVLLSPDGETAAFVSWFWGQPAVRLTSVLVDGTLVETSRLWTCKPPWPRALRSGWAGMDVRQEVERSSVPTRGRSVRGVVCEDPANPPAVATFVDAHRAHVAALGSTPVLLASVDDAIALRRQAFAHDLRVRRRTAVAEGVLVFLTLVMVGQVLGQVPSIRAWPPATLVISSLVFLVWALVHGRLVRVLSYVRWIRPAYR
ncbi:hypothetical protein [Intrasporangium sp. YIM S08009]|uniref:hypothetical protein n=1 Tax=Intrasporangium zincisolvens TaxID=3080018 RepID=UPI002B058EFF|nr:hypothetical protein [Intrasporangium sp. YIM S08009]